MSQNRYPKQRDKNEGAIVDRMRSHGCLVTRMDVPVDLEVGWDGTITKLEVKNLWNSDGKQICKNPWKKATPTQWRYFYECSQRNLPCFMVTTEEEAMQAVLAGTDRWPMDKEEAARKVFGGDKGTT